MPIFTKGILVSAVNKTSVFGLKLELYIFPSSPDSYSWFHIKMIRVCKSIEIVIFASVSQSLVIYSIIIDIAKPG